MAKKKYEDMNEEELAEARIALDEQVAELRAEMRAIQGVIDLRRAAANVPEGYTLVPKGIESKEAHGKIGGK